MPGIRILSAGFMAMAMILALGAAQAQTTTTSAQVGQPLALLAGLRPPHEAKHKEAKHAVRVRAVHAKTAAKTVAKTVAKAAAKTRQRRMAAHARHAAATKIATRPHAHHEQAVTASAFAEEPPPQADVTPPPAPNWPTVDAAPANGSAPPAAGPAAAPVADTASPNAAAGTFPNPDASKIQTIKITTANSTNFSAPATAAVASVASTANDNAAAPAAEAPTAFATPAPERQSANKGSTAKSSDPVGSASWIAQVLAAFGGAVAAGAVAWFLIGGGPVRTYG